MVHLATRYVRDLAMVAVNRFQVIEVGDNFSTHALIDQDGGRVRVISADVDLETNAWLSDRGRVRSTPFQGELSPPRFEEPLEALAVDDVYPI